jgi:uncharacterized membrane protein
MDLNFNKKFILEFICILILLLVVDTIWLTLFAGPKYRLMIKDIQGENITPNYKMAVITYIAMALLLFLFINKNFTSGELFLGGFLSYAIYDFTNATIFTKWDKIFGLFDSIWGGILFCIVGNIINKYLK